jgi:hypothetical protein
MRIDVHNLDRQPLGRIETDESAPPADACGLPLQWEQALDDQRRLKRCPVCGCRDLFVRKDFPQKLGMAMVVVAAVVALGLFASGNGLWAFAVLGAMAVVDACVYLLTGKLLVCYRCRSEFRDTPVSGHEPYELATGEKYRQVTP